MPRVREGRASRAGEAGQCPPGAPGFPEARLHDAYADVGARAAHAITSHMHMRAYVCACYMSSGPFSHVHPRHYVDSRLVR